jgi:EAL domain-containing protein (putative c-di-GMP-specific phosphodiesterase class I)
MIREIGARVSIDDFGVGYSSLSALADITADEIKVDRSFITDVHRRPRSQSILKAIESLGQLLGMSVIVEGVETFEELTYLLAATRISCAQGYYFGKPLLLEDLKPAYGLGNDSRAILPTRGTPVTRIASARASHSR